MLNSFEKSVTLLDVNEQHNRFDSFLLCKQINPKLHLNLLCIFLFERISIILISSQPRSVSSCQFDISSL